MKQLFALIMMAIVAVSSPAVLAGDKGKGAEKSAMKGENASEMGKTKRAEGKAKAEANKEAAKAKGGDDDEDEAEGEEDKDEE